MINKDKYINYFKKNIKNKTNQSKYWLKRKLDIEEINNFYTNQWFGAVSGYSFIKYHILKIIYYFVYGRNILNSDIFNKVAKIKKKINLNIDHDTMRHVVLINYLKDKIKNLNIKKICIIGDGRCNGLIACHAAFPNAKYILINLPQIQFAEYMFLKKTKLFSKKQIEIAKKNQNYKKIYMITANQKNAINNVKADLFIDICAFQEMNDRTIFYYLNLIKKSKAYFYSYNRYSKNINEKKKFNFLRIMKKYKNSIIILEKTKLLNYYFNSKFFFIHKVKEIFYHALLKF